jgi:hypothetical protein
VSEGGDESRIAGVQNREIGESASHGSSSALVSARGWRARHSAMEGTSDRGCCGPVTGIVEESV